MAAGEEEGEAEPEGADDAGKGPEIDASNPPPPQAEADRSAARPKMRSLLTVRA